MQGLERFVVGVVDAAVLGGSGERSYPLEDIHHHEPTVRIDSEPVLQKL